jgi:hypothetical protein
LQPAAASVPRAFASSQTGCLFHASTQDREDPEMTFPEVLKRPGAYVPIAISLAALAVVLVRIAVAGTAPDADEGTAAHVWQVLMAAQVLATGSFIARWMPRERRSALPVLALQLAAMLAALAPVYLLHL